MNETEDIAKLISNAKKTTPSKVLVKGNINPESLKEQKFKYFSGADFFILIGDWDNIKNFLEENSDKIEDSHVTLDARYSALPMKDLSKVEARVEPGAIIREGAEIGTDCIIMMGAVINIGADIGDGTMIDMNAVIGARAKIGTDCHVGAGAVIAGVLEPPSRKPVMIEDNVLIGANAVILEGVKIGKESIIAAGSVVLEDVPDGVVMAGTPAKKIKKTSEVRGDKKSILKELRNR